MDGAEVGRWHQAIGKGVADAAAERVDHVSVVIAKHGHARRSHAIIVADLVKHGRGVPRSAGVDRAADVVNGVVFRLDGEMPGRVEPREPDALGRVEELGVDLLAAQPGILLQTDDLGEERG